MGSTSKISHDNQSNHFQVGTPPGPDGRVEVHLVDLGSTSVLPIAALRTGVHSQLSQVLLWVVVVYVVYVVVSVGN